MTPQNRTRAVLSVLVGLLVMGWAGGLSAHHGRAGVYSAEEITLDGTVAAFRWANPHVHIYWDVVDEEGNVVQWAVETHNPTTMTREWGWNRTILAPGDQITVTLRPANSGKPVGIVRKIVLPDSTIILDEDAGTLLEDR